jgi:hypothetical protein
MVAVYSRVIKTTVWPVRNQGVDVTIGITGPLVSHGLGRFVEISQVCAVGLVWAVAWLAIRRGARPIPWMALAVLAFCMTTLWPLYYIYFDVLFLLVAAALSEELAGWNRNPVSLWAGIVAIAVMVTTTLLFLAATKFPAFDFASRGDWRWLYKGTIGSNQGGETLPWIWGNEATVAIPRRSAVPADIIIDAQPVVPRDAPGQSVTALLNGRFVATIAMRRGWQQVRLRPPADAWLAGANELRILCGSSTPPIAAGLGLDGRHLALGIRAIAVSPPK